MPDTDSEDQADPAVAFLTVRLARDPAVRHELRLSAPQARAVDDAVTEVDQPLWLLRDVPPDQGRERVERLRSQFQRRLGDSLSPAQVDRLDQLVLQARGYQALTSPEISQRLELSREQINRIDNVVAQARSQPVDSQKILAVLSSSQRATLTSLVGKPFDLGQVVQVGVVAPN